MHVLYRLTPNLRESLKNPIGLMIPGPYQETMRKLKQLVEKEKPRMLISVGDRVSENLSNNGFTPKLYIVDNKIMRKKIDPIKLAVEKILHTKNPPGTITQEALKTIQSAIKDSQTVKIVVEGEEDLLTLAAIFYAPEHSFVVYGQPKKGIVIVKVTTDKRTEVTKLLKAMEYSKS
ncbi:MAG: DUF359 domain-containing protein [Candidatus Bathyarchaeota archaeon]